MYVITLRLTPAFSANLARPGVMDAITEAAGRGEAPEAEALAALGMPSDFATLFIARLRYLLRLRTAGVLRSAGPFADLKEGLYLCDVTDEAAVRRVIEDDPLYRAGYIEKDYELRRWLAAL